MIIQSPPEISEIISPSRLISIRSSFCSVNSSLILQSEDITIGLLVNVCGAIGTSKKELEFGLIIGPPQLSEYAVDPVGVETMYPSPSFELTYCH